MRPLLVLLPALLAAGPGLAETVTIGRDACRRAVAHQPAPDVTYQPGRDVHGRPVAPADLSPSPITPPDTIAIDLKTNLYTTPTASRPILGEAVVGRVEVSRDGRITFNGQPLTAADQAAVEAACREHLRRR